MTTPGFYPGQERGLVTIVVPAKDEEQGIGSLLRSLPLATLRSMGFDAEVFVLDGQSRDATAEIARRHGAIVVPDEASGKGSAVRNARGRFRGDHIVMLDADGTYAPDAIPRVVAPLAWGDADAVAGYRVPQDGSMPGHHVIGNALLSMAAGVLCRRACPDLCTGLWGFRIGALRSLPLQSNGFGLEAELFALSARLGLRVVHVPVDYLPRKGTTKLHSGRDGLRIVRRLVRSRLAPLPEPPHENGARAPAPPLDDGEVPT